MPQWLRALFAWREVFRCGVYAYEENSVTGERRAYRVNSGGYSPLDRAWLEAGRAR